MLIKNNDRSIPPESQVTDEEIYRNRRRFLQKLGFVGAGSLLAATNSPLASAAFTDFFSAKKTTPFKVKPLSFTPNNPLSTTDVLTPEAKVISYNNFYEFGTKKEQPAELAQQFKVDPWQLTISGEVAKPITLGHDDLFSLFPIEERVYRLRCVEAWSMVIPWLGFPLASLLKKVQPTSKAKYVAFETLYDEAQMPGQASTSIGGRINYPYVEGLRLDEAMNPLTLMSVGLYGKTLPPQNGAPIRLVVPWKYGFKSIKSVVSIKLLASQPPTTWSQLAPREYGFYANVNPDVDHPRWSQASERRITSGGLFQQQRIPTLPFNGYGEQVAHLYQGMNLGKYY